VAARNPKQITLPWTIDDLAHDDYEIGATFSSRTEGKLKEFKLDEHPARMMLERQLYDELFKAAHAFDALNKEWALLRPLLDDALEMAAVVYLRQYRHGMRYMVDHAITRIRDYIRHPERERQFRDALSAIDNVIAAGDFWNYAIGSIRRDARNDAL